MWGMRSVLYELKCFLKDKFMRRIVVPLSVQITSKWRKNVMIAQACPKEPTF